MSKIDKAVKKIVNAVEDAERKKTTSYDTVAEVKRVEGDTAWVHIAGGIDETPVKLTVNAREGDRVQIRISGRRAWITGNRTNPPTDDRVANRAVTVANDAKEAADTAWKHADSAKQAADTAWDYADSAHTAADTAWAHADNALIAANTANRAANGALTQLGVVQDVVGTLNWIAEHGEYVATTDTTVDPNQFYFVYDSATGTYDSIVPEGDENPQQEGWYILVIDEAITNYVATHIALTDSGLWILYDDDANYTKVTGAYNPETQYFILVNGIYVPVPKEESKAADIGNYYIQTIPSGKHSGYKVRIGNDGVYIYDSYGSLVSTFGENIEFSSDRAQFIGGEDSYIIFDPTTSSITIGGPNVNIGTNKKLSDVLTSLDVSVRQTATGADITVNGDTVSLTNGAKGDKGDKGDNGAKGDKGDKGAHGDSENLLVDANAPSMTKIDAKYGRYISDANNTTTTGVFIADDNLPAPYYTHFCRITNTTKGKYRALCFYGGQSYENIIPLIPGTTYKVGCWVRQLTGDADFCISIAGLNIGDTGFIPTPEWQWFEKVFTMSKHGYDTVTTYGRIYFYNWAGANFNSTSTKTGVGQIDMCGYQLTKINEFSGGGRNVLLNTKDYTDWVVASGTTIEPGDTTSIVNFPAITADAWRELRPTRSVPYSLVRNRFVTLSLKVKGNKDELCRLVNSLTLTSSPDNEARKRYNDKNYDFYATGDWQTIAYSFHISDEIFRSGTDTVNYDTAGFNIRFFAGNTVHAGFKIKELMLNLGSEPCSWSPAPEDAVAETQRVYLRTSTNTRPNTPGTWITDDTDPGTAGTWTKRHIPAILSSNINYKYLWACDQQKSVGGYYLGSTTPSLDESTTVIDGNAVINGTLAIGKLKETNFENFLINSKAPRALAISSTDNYGTWYDETEYGQSITNNNSTDLFSLSFDWSCTQYNGVFYPQFDSSGSTWSITNIVEAAGTHGPTEAWVAPSSTNNSGHVDIIFKQHADHIGKEQQRPRFRFYQNTTTGGALTISNLVFARADSVAAIRSQEIHYRSNSTTVPTAPTTWVTRADTVNSAWTLKQMPYDTTYKYIYSCTQKQSVTGAIVHTTVALDDTTTVIDGGHILTNTITADAIKANTINADKITLADFTNYITVNENDSSSLITPTTIVDGWCFKSNASNTNCWVSNVKPNWAQSGEVYRITGQVKLPSAGRFYAYIYGRDAAGSAVTNVSAVKTGIPSNTITNIDFSLTINDAVANCERANICLSFLVGDTGSTYQTGYFRNFKCMRKYSGSMLVDGSLTVGALSSAEQNKVLNSKISVGGENLLISPHYSYPHSYLALQACLTEQLIAGQEYTMQVWGLSFANTPAASTDNLGFYLGGGSVRLGTLTPNSSGYACVTFTPTADQIAHNDAKKQIINFYNTTPQSAKTAWDMTIGKVKLEKGNKPTDWSLSPYNLPGRQNLLAGTAYMKVASGGFSAGAWRSSSSSPATATLSTVDIANPGPQIEGLKKAIRVTNTGTGTGRIGFCQDLVPGLRTGNYYTFSFWIRAYNANLWVDAQHIWLSSSQYCSEMHVALTPGGWTFVSSTAKLVGDQASTYSAGYIYVNNVPVNSWFEVCGMKLEEGDSATGWTPQLADTNEYITKIDQNGIFISPASQLPTESSTGNSLKLNANGMYIYKGGVERAYFTADATAIGTVGQGRSIIKNDGLHVYTYDGSQHEAAFFGATARIGKTTQNYAVFDAGKLKGYTSNGSNPFEISWDIDSESYKLAEINVKQTVDVYSQIRLRSSDRSSRLEIKANGYSGNDRRNADILLVGYNTTNNSSVSLAADTIDLKTTSGVWVTGALRCTGDIYASNHSTAIGDESVTSATSDTSVAANTGTRLVTKSLTAGTWLLIGSVRWVSNANGVRRINISTTSGATDINYQHSPSIGGQVTQMVFSKVVKPTAATTYYLNGFSTVATTVATSGTFIQAVRIA